MLTSPSASPHSLPPPPPALGTLSPPHLLASVPLASSNQSTPPITTSTPVVPAVQPTQLTPLPPQLRRLVWCFPRQRSLSHARWLTRYDLASSSSCGSCWRTTLLLYTSWKPCRAMPLCLRWDHHDLDSGRFLHCPHGVTVSWGIWRFEPRTQAREISWRTHAW